MSLSTPVSSVQKLQTALHAKAKSEPNYKFYSLWDKIYRKDILHAAYAKCRKNDGSPGMDGESFSDIEDRGIDQWLGTLEKELKSKDYRTQPLLRVWIPKANGEQRPLGIPTIKDRVVQAAVCLIIEPIFEADLLPNQYGFRPKLDAKLAIRRIYYQVVNDQKYEVLDADLSDYFNTIPHGPLMKCVSRRIVDGYLLSVIKQWLQAPVVERDQNGDNSRGKQTTEAKDKNRGTPQGGVISPLLANLYFRRFILAWRKLGFAKRWNAHIVNYADDFVICTTPGNGAAVMEATYQLMSKLGLQVNGKKTRIATLPEGQFDFLGYTFGRFYGKGGKAYLGTKPSRKSICKVIRKIHEETSPRWCYTTPEKRVVEVNAIIRGWSGYFNQGPVLLTYQILQKYTIKRLRKWLVRKRKQRSRGNRQYPDEFFYKELGLFKLPTNRAELAKAKA